MYIYIYTHIHETTHQKGSEIHGTLGNQGVQWSNAWFPLREMQPFGMSTDLHEIEHAVPGKLAD